MQFKGKIHTQSWESRQEEEERRGGCGNLLSWLRSASLFLGDFTPASPPPPLPGHGKTSPPPTLSTAALSCRSADKSGRKSCGWTGELREAKAGAFRGAGKV